MQGSTWTFTALRDGRPDAIYEGLSGDEAVAAVRAAMYGEDLAVVEHRRRDGDSPSAVGDERPATSPLAA
jgi:UDP-glucose 4-epimerase